MQPPIPSSEAPSPEASCPNCGQPIGTTRATYCPRCGASFQKPSSSVSCLKIFGAIFLALMAMPMGTAGACIILIGGASGLQNSSRDQALPLIGTGIGCLFMAAFLVWGMIKLLKR